MSKRWPKPFAEMQARRALQALPDKVRPFYHAEYKIALYSDQAERHGDFAGLVCNECDHWREYGHKKSCRVLRYETDYRWHPRLIKTIGRLRIRKVSV